MWEALDKILIKDLIKIVHEYADKADEHKYELTDLQVDDEEEEEGGEEEMIDEDAEFAQGEQEVGMPEHEMMDEEHPAEQPLEQEEPLEEQQAQHPLGAQHPGGQAPPILPPPAPQELPPHPIQPPSQPTLSSSSTSTPAVRTWASICGVPFH